MASYSARTRKIDDVGPGTDAERVYARGSDSSLHRRRRQHTTVCLITIEEGGHTIPQATFDFPAYLILGKTFRSDVPLESAFDALGLAK